MNIEERLKDLRNKTWTILALDQIGQVSIVSKEGAKLFDELMIQNQTERDVQKYLERVLAIGQMSGYITLLEMYIESKQALRDQSKQAIRDQGDSSNE